MNSSTTEIWKQVQNGSQHTSETFSVVINLFLILLIVKKSPENFGPYKYLMIYISIFEMLYSIADFLVSPIFYSYGSALIVIVNQNNSLFNRFFSYILLCVYSGFFGSSMAIFGIHFIYRYLVASGHPLLATFSTWKIILWLGFPVFYGFIWGLGSYFACAPTEYTNEYVREDVMENYGLRIEEIVYFGLHFYGKTDNGETFIAYYQVIGVIFNCLIIGSSLSVAVFFGIKCYQKITNLASHSQVSVQNKNLQCQLFYALVIQTIIPIALMHIPVTIIYCFAFLGYGMRTICGIASITISMYPAFDPLPTLFIIKNYRDAVLNYIRCCRKKIQSESHAPSGYTMNPIEPNN